MEPLLFLVHRIPYPPNKGDKIRSYHLLKYLARHFDVYLGAFVDNRQDWQYARELQSLCKELKLLALRPGLARLRSLQGLVSGKALTLPYYASAELQRWVDTVIGRHGIKRCVIYSSAMAQFLLQSRHRGLSRVADFVDVDSDKWRQYSKSHSFPLAWLYRREADRLAAFEQRVAREFDAVLLVSHDELKVFRQAGDAENACLDYYNNGVDDAYFDPALELQNPYAASHKVLVFTGAMDYWANVDAVKWFADEVLPQVYKEVPTAQFYIVGANPAEEVIALGRRQGITVTGSVADIRPYLCHAQVSVAPLRIARGIQNKVLEAMAMARPIVATPAAMEGIETCAGYAPVVATEAGDFARACIQLLNQPDAAGKVPAARQCVQAHYNWEVNLQRLGRHLGIAAPAPPVAHEAIE